MEFQLTQPYPVRRALSGASTLLPGLLLSAGLAGLAIVISRLPLPMVGTLGPLTLAMLLGLILGQRLPLSITDRSASGTALARTRLLRIGIILYGLRISFADLLNVGTTALITDLCVVVGIFLLAGWIGTRFLKLEPKTALLVGAGSAVCGAAAILAMAPALRARAQDIPVAIATVVLFGTASMLLYPWMWTLPTVQQLFGGSELDFGRYLGATVHEVAQVAAAAGALNDEAGQAAVITKLIRVMLLVPLILVVSSYFGRKETDSEGKKAKVSLPWFALIFLLMPLINATGLLSAEALAQIEHADTFILAMAMAALGVETRFATLKSSGTRPLILGGILFIVLITAGAAISVLCGYYF